MARNFSECDVTKKDFASVWSKTTYAAMEHVERVKSVICEKKNTEFVN